ncbi:bifunctional DNA primase/polymerase [Brevibacterium permense]|uniref:bifunctional DNA primase/polymerase n=1 Tax=Brevibacterium permense TaxID=234834 RepID=UPI0021CED15D|nr:bifunctional DNA primase/polymerase [Brevibacterium permense]
MSESESAAQAEPLKNGGARTTLPLADVSASFDLDDLVAELDDGLASSAALNAATAAEAGVPVVALVPEGKQPTHAQGLGSRSQPFSRAEQVLDHEIEVQRTMGQRPNWGLLCGRGLAVLDLDGPEGRAWLDELAARHAEVSVWARSTLRVTTGRTDGGVHLYAAVPEGVDLLTASGAVAPHVDVRGAGFYVVGPGCRHASGAFYRITTDLGYHLAAAKKDTGAVRDLFPIVDDDEGVTMLSALTVPEVLLDLMRRPEDIRQGQRDRRHDSGASATVDLSLPEARTTVPSAYVEKAVEGVLADLRDLGNLGEGQRNERGHGWDMGAFVAAVRLVELSNADPEGHPLDDVRKQFLAACPQSRQFGSRQAEHKWASAFQHVGDRPADIKRVGTEGVEIVTTTAEPSVEVEIVPETVDVAEGDPVDISVDELARWRPVDLDTIITGLESGTITRERPTLGRLSMAREDGTALFYKGRINGLAGDSGSGKSWTALTVVAQELAAEHHVMYLDLEDSAVGIVGRLLEAGVPGASIRSHLDYISPSGRLTPAWEEFSARLTEVAPSLVVIDSVGESLSDHGGDPNADKDATRWFAEVPKRIAEHPTGPCVLILDHITKAAAIGGTGDGYAAGSYRKKAAITGVQVIQKVKKPFARGISGEARLKVVKDRLGNWVAGSEVAALMVSATGAAEGVTVGLDLVEVTEGGADSNAGGQTGGFRPTRVMEAVARYLASAHGEDERTGREVRKNVRGANETVGTALAALVDEGYVEKASGPRRRETFTLVRPFAVSTDEGPEKGVD